MILVLDADCLVAGTIAGRGAAFELIEHWRDGAFELVACPRLVEEVRKALSHPRVAHRYRVAQADVDELVDELTKEAIWMDDPVDPPRLVSADPGDDYLVALARAATAEALITRDSHFDGVVVEGVKIVPPRFAVRWLASGNAE